MQKMLFFATALLFSQTLFAAELFRDDFEDGDVSDWTFKNGTWSAARGQLTGTATRKADALSSFSGCGNCEITGILRIETPQARVSILGWYRNRANSVELRLFHDRQKILIKQRSDGLTVAKESVPFPIDLNTDYICRIRYSAGVFQAYINDVRVLREQTTVAPFGTVGFRVASTNDLPATASLKEIFVTDSGLVTDTDYAINLTVDSTADDQNPAFSPDGSQIVFSSKRNGGGTNLNVWKMNLNGSDAVPLTADTDFDNINLPGSSWNPVLNKICFSSDRSGNDEIWMMDPDGTNLTQLTNHPAREWEPSFSPDGNWIVFQSDRDGNWEIYKLNITDGSVTRLTNDPADDWEPNWSPADNRIVFQSLRSGEWELYTMYDDGTSVTNITSSPASEDTDPSWSPDGAWIVYSSNYDGQPEPDIYLIPSNGGTPRRITNSPAYDGAPSFSPDGKSIAFESNRSGNLDIWIVSYWNTVDDFAYQLQNVDLAAAGNLMFDLFVIDYSSDGSEAGRYTFEEIQALKHSGGGEKLVLGYMSIGEAENYRWYWQTGWDADQDGNPDPGAPAWLGPANPDWPGNYKVRYWDPDWQALIYGTFTSYLDKIVDAGFDGVYLDIIDAYEYWGPGGESGENRITAEQEMIDFVKNLAAYARATRGKVTFGVFPQNGELLSTHADYVAVVSGIGKEDTWYNDNNPQSPDYTQEVLDNLDVFRQAGKLVLVVDYCTQPALIDDFYAQALLKSYVPYATVRDLDVLTINPGHEPD